MHDYCVKSCALVHILLSQCRSWRYSRLIQRLKYNRFVMPVSAGNFTWLMRSSVSWRKAAIVNQLLHPFRLSVSRCSWLEYLVAHAQAQAITKPFLLCYLAEHVDVFNFLSTLYAAGKNTLWNSYEYLGLTTRQRNRERKKSSPRVPSRFSVPSTGGPVGLDNSTTENNIHKMKIELHSTSRRFIAQKLALHSWQC